MNIAIPEILMILFGLIIPVSVVVGIYFIINNMIKKSNALKNENNQLLREIVDLLKKQEN